MQPIIIIGAGLAGYTVARELRKLDKTVQITVVTADDGGFYSKPMLSNAFAQKKEVAHLVTQTAKQMGTQLAATVLAHTRVDHIDTSARTLQTSAGKLEYGKLVIAAGARPIRLPIEGSGADRVQSVNHLGDYAAFRDRLESAAPGTAAKVAILGAGLIGCEFADDLAGAGHEVTLIDPNSLPLAALAAPALSQGLKIALSERGVTLRLGATAARIDKSGVALQVTLSDGSVFAADLVLSAVGLRPDTALAQAAGIVVARGIVVDGYGRTSASDVYALGDCAEYTFDTGTRVLPYITPLMSAARAIARTLLGTATPIDLKHSPVIVKTPSYPLALLPPAVAAAGKGYWVDQTEGHRLVCRFYDHAHMLAGFGASHHEAGLRQSLLTSLGTVRADAA